MKTLKQCIALAEKKKVALGHFNISNLEGVWAVFNAAKELAVPVIIGVSEGERDFVGVKAIATLVKSLQKEYNYPLFLNADHTYSIERVTEVVDAGYDAVIFDGAKMAFEDNVALAKKCRAYIDGKSPHMLLEGELGYIGQSSKVLDKIPEGVDPKNAITDPEEAKRFVEVTGCDLLAPAVGNFHGMLRTGDEPLQIDAIVKIRKAAGVPLVLHGGSGISKEDFQKAIAAGIAIIHINTELRVAYRKGLEEALAKNPDEISPYKYLAPARNAMQAAVLEKLKIFNNLV
jgi:fructose-bisphosphate aldolase, class II